MMQLHYSGEGKKETLKKKKEVWATYLKAHVKLCLSLAAREEACERPHQDYF